MSGKGPRALAPHDQLRVLSRIWRNDRDGYVFLPWIKGDSATKEARRKNYHEGRAFLWPRERSAILEHLQAHQNDDLYFCPNLFNGKRRQEELVYAEMALYADLDEVDPRKLPSGRRPTIAWESSPGRYQGAWLLGSMREGATWAGRENQRLTYELGADLSGWDATQLLRVPGKPNYKHDYRKDNGGEAVPGRLLWDNGPRYGWDDFDDLPEVGVVGGDEFDLMDEELLAGIDRHEVWARVRMRCSPTVRQYMAARNTDEIDGADRSDVIWQICRDLADAGCTLAEIVAITRPTVWNKYVGRNDELRRLKTEAAKAIEESAGGGALETTSTPKPELRTTVDHLFNDDIPRPRWLVRDVWPEGGCGFIAGAPKSYKTWIALDLAVALTTGAPFLGDARFPVVGRNRTVIYLQQEDGKPLVRDRLETVIDGKSPRHARRGMLRWNAAAKRVIWEPPLPMRLYAEVRTGFTASDEGWLSWLDEYVAEVKADAVVIDTLFASAGALDLDKGTELMSAMLHPLRQLSDKHNCAVIIVHHNKKDSGGGGNGAASGKEIVASLGGRAGRDMLGSVAMHAWVDTALYVRARMAVDRLPGVSVGDGRGGFAGVPGTEIFVERESKLAEEIRLRVGIPKMQRARGGETEDDAGTVWTPQVQIGWHREEEGEDNGSGGNKAEDGDKKRGRRPGKPAGVLVAERLREMGVTAKRGKTIEEIESVLDLSQRTVRKQLKDAVERDLVRKDEDGRWCLMEDA